MSKSKRLYVWYLVIAIIMLLAPTAIYLGFLIPKMHDEYTILMASGGCIGGAGMFGANMIPDKVKFGTLYKTAAKSFTLLTVITLVKDFIPQIIGLIATIIVSYILFVIFRELYRNGKRRKQDTELAEKVAQSITLCTE